MDIFFFNDTATTEIYTLSLHDALPILGFEAYARTAGFPHYYGRTEYNEANPGNDDFDGHWGIWDEKFFQFYANNLSTFRQPFATALFSLSSHHPFAVPAEYEGDRKSTRLNSSHANISYAVF